MSFAGSCCSYALLTFSLTLVVCLSIDDLLAVGEVCPDLCLSGHGSLHPVVSEHLLDSGSLSWVQSHHLLEEIFELVRVDALASFSFSMGVPEQFRTASCDKAVMWILWVGRSERWSLSQNDEKDDGRGEQINTGTLVVFAKVDLWCHVRGCSELCL